MMKSLKLDKRKKEKERESEKIYEISILGFGSRIQHRTRKDKNNSWETMCLVAENTEILGRKVQFSSWICVDIRYMENLVRLRLCKNYI